MDFWIWKIIYINLFIYACNEAFVEFFYGIL